MPKIEGWKKLGEGAIEIWENTNAPAIQMQIYVEKSPRTKKWIVTGASIFKLQRLATKNTKEDAVDFAVKWMKNHPYN